ncbi:N5-carboxyaminoimidazole ribonucleotide mutase [Gammaproteobacteria bacterium]
MNDTFAAVLMGSDSDLPTVQGTIDVLDQLRIPCEVKITSAHRTPAATVAYVQDAEARGCAVFICAAGLAAHLAGTVAAQTIRPVIGIPMESGPLNGIDALLSTVQMPGGIPVACMAIGRAGARNAGYLAAQIIALSDPELAIRLRADRETSAAAVLSKDIDLRRGRGQL